MHNPGAPERSGAGAALTVSGRLGHSVFAATGVEQIIQREPSECEERCTEPRALWKQSPPRSLKRDTGRGSRPAIPDRGSGWLVLYFIFQK